MAQRQQGSGKSTAKSSTKSTGRSSAKSGVKSATSARQTVKNETALKKIEKTEIVTRKSRADAPRELTSEQVRWHCPESIFNFDTTKEIGPLNTIVGQHRAMESLRLGAGIKSPGFNVFVSGLSGTGRLTTIEAILAEVTKSCPPTFDYCYVYNFCDPDKPRLLKFPQGRGHEFEKAMDEAISFIRRRIPQLFEEEGFQKSRQEIIQTFHEKEKDILREFDEKIRPSGFALGQIEDERGTPQPEIFPIINDKPTSINDLDELVSKKKISDKKVEELKQQYKQFRQQLFELAKVGMKIMQEYRKAVAEHDRAATALLVDGFLDDLYERFPFDRVLSYLIEVKKDILDNIQLFSPGAQQDTQGSQENSDASSASESALEKFGKYAVNVILDNSGTDCAPVVVETTPSFVNLFGTIERKVDTRGSLKTDFRNIKAGSILKADQGYLIVNAIDVLNEPGVWPVLKRALLYGKLEIQAWDNFQGAQRHLKPEPIELNVKVLMIGDSHLYHWLYFREEDFKKMFKINAEFDYEADLTDEIIISYAHFIHKICEEEHLPHFDRSGVAAVVEWAVRHTDNQRRISLKFSDVADVLRETAFYAQKMGAAVISRREVEYALIERRHRNNLLSEKIRNHIVDGILLVDTEGERVGQINGLTVYSTGVVSFGKPVRITATISAGNADIINIEREVDLSGSIHNKGMLILAGLLRDRFAQKRPLTLSASIAFEQSYGDIDGDSASAAETYALLSAITGIPIRQYISVTGSINQKGDIQPIGGVNDKIRGFFEVCEARGLTGNQGVMIPFQNVQDLMLPHKIVDAVKAGQFHIYPFERLEDGVEILMGMKAGERQKNGQYPAGTLFKIVEDRLAELYSASVEQLEQKIDTITRTPRKKKN
ncbi:MAG TPA: AAA family ATPase [Patescibacteria group bacterium]|nr:AAA family ATPase [Patescibacteria group bacterium]